MTPRKPLPPRAELIHRPIHGRKVWMVGPGLTGCAHFRAGWCTKTRTVESGSGGGEERRERVGVHVLVACTGQFAR